MHFITVHSASPSRGTEDLALKRYLNKPWFIGVPWEHGATADRVRNCTL